MAVKKPKRRERPVLEIQFHSGSIRRGVRYFFLTRRQIGIALAAGGLCLVWMFFSLAASPWVVRSLLNRQEYHSLGVERARQGERLQALTDELAGLGTQTEELHLRMSRIYLAYGLDSGASMGQGGFPFEARAVPESIYAGQIRRANGLEARIHEQLGVLATFIGEIQSFETAHSDQVRTTPSVSPLPAGQFVLTSPFGNRRSPFTKNIDFHPGLDLAAAIGAPIRAPADGTVVFAGRYPVRQSVSWWRYGNLVALRHGSRFISLFGHCDEIQVRTGQKVEQGEVIATVGNSGWSTSPHLHYEVRLRDGEGDYEPVDPRVYILDYQWRDEELLLVRGRRAPDLANFEPLPPVIRR